MTVYEAAQSGDRRKTLEAMRDKLAAAMDEAESNVAANISGQLHKVVDALSELGKSGEVVKHNELGARREGRIAKAASVPSAVAKGRKRGA